jgi:hypothetical protein
MIVLCLYPFAEIQRHHVHLADICFLRSTYIVLRPQPGLSFPIRSNTRSRRFRRRDKRKTRYHGDPACLRSVLLGVQNQPEEAIL